MTCPFQAKLKEMKVGKMAPFTKISQLDRFYIILVAVL